METSNESKAANERKRALRLTRDHLSRAFDALVTYDLNAPNDSEPAVVAIINQIQEAHTNVLRALGQE
jgi:hypothetical protein